MGCSFSGQLSSASRGENRSLGIILEQGRHGEAEAGEEVAAVELLADAQHLDLLGCGIVIDLGLLGIDDPDPANSGVKIIVDLLLDFIMRSCSR